MFWLGSIHLCFALLSHKTNQTMRESDEKESKICSPTLSLPPPYSDLIPAGVLHSSSG